MNKRLCIILLLVSCFLLIMISFGFASDTGLGDSANVANAATYVSRKAVRVIAGLFFGVGILGAIAGKLSGKSVILYPAVIVVVVSFIYLLIPDLAHFWIKTYNGSTSF